MAMRLADRLLPIRKGRVTLVAKRTFGISGNIRVLAEALADMQRFDLAFYYEGPLDDAIAKALMNRSVTLLRDFDQTSASFLASSELVVVDHSIRDCYISERKPGRTIVNVWHGVPIKGIELSMPSIDDQRRQLIEKNSALYDWMIASSHIDRMAISSSFGVSPAKVWSSGLPRYDILSKDFVLPSDLEEQEQRLLLQKGERSLLLYAPTFRESGPSPVSAVAEKLPELSARLAERGYCFGIRPHPYDREASALCESEGVLDLGARRFPETNLVLKHTDLLVTDFSSIWVDFLLTGRPIVGFATDFEHYLENERGFLYDFENVFAGTFCHDLPSLFRTLEALMSKNESKGTKELAHALFLPQSPGPYGEAVARRLATLLE